MKPNIKKSEGASIIAVARREGLLAELVERITTSGGYAVAVPANLTDLDQSMS